MNKAQVWFCCLSVLHCPMSVEDKIKTLEIALFSEIDNLDFVNVPETGLEPFDKAVKSYAVKLTQDIGNE
ncbi:hypothetical protein H6F44_19580 [Pseudanabaena sp. FACHB-1277]|uniref:Uncharacterized protein n=1 Tax=Pseudanabaena cinerea FACHB-1277 TaxID=2949581 RepID=A0A926Z7Z0_9CYAN|nr:hypothetical protein [Pseudanabaena cinerea]MBD2152300.1 hypothetical protein [Pseudanabaena cinerea FACHB-1277]